MEENTGLIVLVVSALGQKRSRWLRSFINCIHCHSYKEAKLSFVSSYWHCIFFDLPKYECIGFLDGNSEKWGKSIFGIKVLGPLHKSEGIPL